VQPAGQPGAARSNARTSARLWQPPRPPVEGRCRERHAVAVSKSRQHSVVSTRLPRGAPYARPPRAASAAQRSERWVVLQRGAQKLCELGALRTGEVLAGTLQRLVDQPLDGLVE
jgi:hypothetical protein